jgi:hypothetical protein
VPLAGRSLIGWSSCQAMLCGHVLTLPPCSSDEAEIRVSVRCLRVKSGPDVRALVFL